MDRHLPAGPFTRYVSRDLAKALPIVAAVYFVAGRLGLAVPFTSGNVSPVWPAAGIALGAILLLGPRVWPAVAVGAFLVNVLTHVPATSALLMAVGNTVGPLVGAWLLRRTGEFDPCLGRLRDVVRLIVLGAFGGTAVSATLGTAAVAVGEVPAWSSVQATWLMWWLGDAMGVLVVTPLALAIPFLRGAPNRRRGFEVAALLLTTVACADLVFKMPPELAGSSYGILALTFPFLLVWGATRFEVPGAALITASLTTVAIWESRYGLGPFVIGTPLQNAGLLQSFVTIIAVSGLSVAALTVDRTRLIREQAEREAARLGEERYREIAETANEGVWMLDSRLLTCFVNKRLTQMLGYSAEEMLGAPVTAFSFETDAARKLADLERRKRGVSEQLETRYRCKNGSELWARVSTSGSFDAAGRFTGVLAMVSDITDQKRREAEGRVSRQELLLLTRAVEQTADSVVVTDKRGVIEYVNPAFEGTTGYPRNEAIGHTPAILKSGHHDAEFYRNLWEELLAGRTYRGTLVNRKKTGALYWAEQTITPIKSDEGEITHFVSVLKDITELRRKHEQEVQLRLAHQVQQRFYQRPTAVPGLDLAAVSQPATETGGDYFDFIPAAGGVYVAVGDASGHGLGAALVMALTRAYVRSLTALNLDVAEILTRVNRMLLGDLEENRFVTLLLAQVDRASRRLRYANAGHVAGLMIGGSDPSRPPASLTSTGIPLGLFSRASYPARELVLEPQHVVLMVTDGVTESESHGEEFGVERLVAYARAHACWSARSLARGICRSARRFAGADPQVDDITSVVIKVTPLASAGDGARWDAAAAPASS